MFVEYNQLPNNSRVWVYQSDREFTQEEIDFISKKAQHFIEQWTRHGSDLKGSFTIKYHQFLVLAVDEGFNNVSGCSIDASVHFVQELQKALQVDLLDKMNISFKVGEHINVVKMNAFKEFAKQQKVNADTVVFNNMVTTKAELEEAWEVPAEQSWHKRFLV
jgi:hypothetical protein